jgi:hypothetical protein
MVQWGSHSDRTCERKWHAVIFFAAMSSGLAFAAMTASPIVKMTFLCKLGIRPPGRRNCSIYYGWRNQPECRLCHVNPPLSEATIIRRRNRFKQLKPLSLPRAPHGRWLDTLLLPEGFVVLRRIVDLALMRFQTYPGLGCMGTSFGRGGPPRGPRVMDRTA